MGKFEQILIDIIQEQQIKLGYMKETLRLYFPISSLGYLLELDITDEKAVVDQKLTNELSRIKPYFGDIRFTSKDNRYAIIIPPEGSAYVYENVGKNIFLEELIQLFNSHQVNIEKVRSLFNKFDPNYICEKSEDIEFDYLLSFTNNDKDNYYYCIKFDEGHGSYHRFNEHDIKDVL